MDTTFRGDIGWLFERLDSKINDGSIIIYLVKKREKRVAGKLVSWREERREIFLSSLPEPVLWRPKDDAEEKAQHENSAETTSQSLVPATKDQAELCAFCLDEFKLSDLVQKLPQCPHYFHSKCADEWIRRELEASEKAEMVSILWEPRTPEDTLRTISMPCPLCRRRLREVGVPGISEPEPAHVSNAQRLDSVVVGEV
ncbi:hypothetical protein LTR47_011515 [Exophiala xenobiotica]|nr:hypothetical protein LTR47_011515 [Exophiala xenobiotica]KAK5245928.1 hypothetical protein LTS06_008710 [Exophiala xenobiotica]KAK5261506.1 hypothetical protein LTR40_002092 [Exophiala xenobiotica]KAK5332847.1 hypothetical protein LTR98_011040 [Exophiala xenobiotica]KAK5345239.1 hypothetical protein LTR61_011001 [Exophiala xenobiotica]